MTARELLNKLKAMDIELSLDVPIYIQHLKVNIKDIHFDTSTDGKVPYINIQVEEDLNIV